MVVSVAQWLGLLPQSVKSDAGGHGPLRWELTVAERLLNSAGTLWGGVGLSAFVAAAEPATGRRCVWATVQYLAPIRADAKLQMDVDIGGEGIALTQASGRGTVDGRPALLAVGTFGGDGPHDLQFSEAPDFPPPSECPPRELPWRWYGGLLTQVEQRTLPGMALPDPNGQPGSGRSMLWMRLRDMDGQPVAPEVAGLAVLADLAPSGISEAVGYATFGTSLDNSIRAARVAATGDSGWVLMDITVEAAVGRVAQLSARMFDDAGRLLAVAGQSARLRRITHPEHR